jgi:GNAT superfamily N-acetyltransferase
VQKNDEVFLERAADDDAAEIADLYLASRADALPFLRRVHTDDEVRVWVRNVLLTRGETWVARLNRSVVGFVTLIGDDLDQLYLLPGHYRRGIGSLLLAKAKERSPGRLHLFTFQRNERARAFYEAHGFRIVGLNDGSRNGEGEPDVLYEWRLATPEAGSDDRTVGVDRHSERSEYRSSHRPHTVIQTVRRSPSASRGTVHWRCDLVSIQAVRDAVHDGPSTIG